jgi:hypothetical protein
MDSSKEIDITEFKIPETEQPPLPKIKACKRKSTPADTSKEANEKPARKRHAPSGYMLFCKERNVIFRKEYPGKPMGDYSKMIGLEWSADG